MMGYPVYYDMTEEEIMSLSDDEAGSLNTAGTFVIICVKDAENAEEAKDRFLKAMADFSGKELSQEEIDIFSAIKEISILLGLPLLRYLYLYVLVQRSLLS